MKYIILLIAVFVASCSSLSKKENFEYSEFKIQKMTEEGTKLLTFTPSSKEWPEVSSVPSSGLAVNSQKLVVAVMGDTGCRLKESKKGGSYQNCGNLKEWPYPLVAKSLETETFDFVLHTGDYHYREQCTKYENCPRFVGYGWGAWYDDFYGPTQKLFTQAPFLFVRGNHEECDRAHQGWAPLGTYGENWKSDCVSREPTEIITIGDLVMINLDTAEFEDKKNVKPKMREDMLTELKSIVARVKALGPKKEVWLMTHKPVVGFTPDEETAEPVAIKDNLYSLVKESGLADVIDFVLSGHVHNQQVAFVDTRFVQVVVGNSGTSLEPFGRKIQTESLVTATTDSKSFGYAMLARESFKNWNIEFKDVNGKLTMKCQLKKEKSRCEFPLGL